MGGDKHVEREDKEWTNEMKLGKALPIGVSQDYLESRIKRRVRQMCDDWFTSANAV